MSKKRQKVKNWRITIVFLLICVSFGAVIFKLFSLQVINHKFYQEKAKNQHEFSKTINPKRGSIYMKDRAGSIYPLALNKEYADVYVVPKEVIEKSDTASKLSKILNIEENIILDKLNKSGDPYEPIKAKITDEEIETLKREQLIGVYFSFTENRFYPYQDAASSIVGFVSSPGGDFVGQYGLEKFYNNQLAGEKGSITAERGVGGAMILTGDRDYKPVIDGSDLMLTIDSNIQFKAEEILKDAVEKWGAENGSVIISDPKTGAIRAMANWPSYNPNEYSKVKNARDYLNPIVQSVFEPGSIVKPFTMAIGIEQNVITPDTKYIDEGVVKIGGYNITNFDNQAHGEKTMNQVLEMSLNTGVVFVQKKIPKTVFKDFFLKFGFSTKTGIDLPGEVSGSIANLNSNRDINYATASFGQGISATPIQIVAAIGSIANNGVMMKPYMVEEIKYPNGNAVKTIPKEISRVVSVDTASKISTMMTNVVKNGFDKRAGVEGYFIAGKTGTAQIPDGKGGYSDEVIHSFIGFAPASDPKFVVMLKLEKPTGNRFASNTLSMFFGNLTNFLLNYYEIPPDDKAKSISHNQ